MSGMLSTISHLEVKESHRQHSFSPKASGPYYMYLADEETRRALITDQHFHGDPNLPWCVVLTGDGDMIHWGDNWEELVELLSPECNIILADQLN